MKSFYFFLILTYFFYLTNQIVHMEKNLTNGIINFKVYLLNEFNLIPKLQMKNVKMSKCLNRKDFYHEFLYNYINVNFDSNDSFILVWGSQSTTGKLITKYFESKNRKVISLKGFFDCDLSCHIKTLLKRFSIEHFYICYTPLLFPSFSHNQNINFNLIVLRKINDFYQELNLPYTFFFTPPHFQEIKLYLDNIGLNYILLDLFFDSENTDFLNPITQLNQELFFSKILRNFSVYFHYFIRPNQFFLHQYILNTSLTLKNTRVNFKDYYLQAKQQKRHDKNVHNIFSCYLSIIIVGRNDNYVGYNLRLENFLISLSIIIETINIPFDLVLVDYNSIPQNPLLYDLLKVPSNLQKYIVSIVCPNSFHKKYFDEKKFDFGEYIAKNIGIRRADGKFILQMNPDCILLISFFEICAFQMFNPNIFYRSPRYDLKEELRSEQIPKFLNFFDLNKSLLNFKNHWLNFSEDHTFLIQSSKDYKYISLWGPGDFILLSKPMWYLIKGFYQFPMNWGMDAICFYQLLQIRPGFIQYSIPIPVLHQFHQVGHKHRSRSKAYQVPIANFICYGFDNSSYNIHYNTQEWGFPSETFIRYNHN
ncbi:hypothetical protein TRFO_41447 [Tritrichomonas foetus]|uniref:Glycosyltransferase 2-like domain-containing protein n=1 Tax=Tritrichomonas foetus TaxID=1144522 RepID=A0A1J4L0H3_9EUKA|nr:hypothetical protein TRFO_41447 [Tritrichomonas foetus]|eukprot:OHT16898.1 hypothetical protein TRFO_41447 [Tritrichomonas foetus]